VNTTQKSTGVGFDISLFYFCPFWINFFKHPYPRFGFFIACVCNWPLFRNKKVMLDKNDNEMANFVVLYILLGHFIK